MVRYRVEDGWGSTGARATVVDIGLSAAEYGRALAHVRRRRDQNAISAAGEAGVDPEQTIIFGFSQGACVGPEHAIRHPDRYGGSSSPLVSCPARPNAR